MWLELLIRTWLRSVLVLLGGQPGKGIVGMGTSDNLVGRRIMWLSDALVRFGGVVVGSCILSETPTKACASMVPVGHNAWFLLNLSVTVNGLPQICLVCAA